MISPLFLYKGVLVGQVFKSSEVVYSMEIAVQVSDVCLCSGGRMGAKVRFSSQPELFEKSSSDICMGILWQVVNICVGNCTKQNVQLVVLHMHISLTSQSFNLFISPKQQEQKPPDCLS